MEIITGAPRTDRSAISIRLPGARKRNLADFKVGVWMDDATRKEVLVAYQNRKQDEITHRFLGEKTTVGMLFHLQALLLARFLRGDLDGYPPFVMK